MNKVITVVATLLLASILLSGCSFSNSSKSSSNIISSPFKSSSTSSKDATFESDTVEYTDAFASDKKGDMAAFRNGINKIAIAHGVSNWEGETHSWTSIGVGLKEAGLSKDKYANFVSMLNPSELQKQLIMHGYQHGAN